MTLSVGWGPSPLIEAARAIRRFGMLLRERATTCAMCVAPLRLGGSEWSRYRAPSDPPECTMFTTSLCQAAYCHDAFVRRGRRPSFDPYAGRRAPVPEISVYEAMAAQEYL